MPYASNSDLPQAIRDKYGKCASAYRGAFNSTHQKTGDESRAFAAAHAAAQHCQESKRAAAEEEHMAVNFAAAKKAPPLAPGEFRFITKAVQIEPPSESGKRRFKMIASSTVVDMGKDEIKLSALHDLEVAFKRGLNIFTDHDHTVDNVFGRTDTAQIMDSGEKDAKTGAPIYDLHVAGVVNEPDPRMVRLADSIDGGYVTFGASIGAVVKEHQRNKAGGMDIYHLDGKEASLVGIPMNQRSWTYKAAKAAEALDAAELDDEDETEKSLDTETGDALIREDIEGPKSKADKCPTCGRGHGAMDCPDAYHTQKSVSKGDLSAAARNNLDDSDFACPEKRKYPINDEAHVRAALSRVGDPSNDQCGRDKIIAAARRMGIGDHKGMADDELVTWAVQAFPADQIVDDAFIIKTEINPDAAIDSGAEEISPEIVDGQASESSAPETPETASADEAVPDESDPAAAQKAFSFETEDVVTLVKHARDLAVAVNDRDAEIETLKAERDSLATENEVAKQVIEKMMALPLRAKTAGYVEDLSKRLPKFLAPEVKDFLTKDAGGNTK